MWSPHPCTCQLLLESVSQTLAVTEQRIQHVIDDIARVECTVYITHSISANCDNVNSLSGEYVFYTDTKLYTS